MRKILIEHSYACLFPRLGIIGKGFELLKRFITKHFAKFCTDLYSLLQYICMKVLPFLQRAMFLIGLMEFKGN